MNIITSTSKHRDKDNRNRDNTDYKLIHYFLLYWYMSEIVPLLDIDLDDSYIV